MVSPVSDLDTARALLRDKRSRIALVGASRAPHKYGNIILKDLTRRGYPVVPVNPHETTIEGLAVARSLDEVEPPVAIINVVVPPAAALDVVQRTAKPPSDVIWFQPGSYDPNVLDAARERFDTVIAGDCIMVVARTIG